MGRDANNCAGYETGPGALSPWLFFKATAANQKDIKVKRLNEAMPFIIFAAFALKYGLTNSVLVHIFLEFNSQIWTRLYHLWVARLDPAACPALFLYSSRDELVGSTLVERCAADREQAIGRVFRKKWEDSPHVEHLRVHEEEYVEELRSFSAKLEVI